MRIQVCGVHAGWIDLIDFWAFTHLVPEIKKKQVESY